MPRYPIDRATNFIIEDESWTVIEYDHTSVPGVIYLSLTEGKINFIYDDLVNKIADTDKIADYQLSVPEQVQRFAFSNTPINPVFTLTKNGIPIDLPVNYISENKQIVKVVDNQLIPNGFGDVNIRVQLRDYPSIETILKVIIDNSTQEFSAYIEGNETIRLDRKAQYVLRGTSDITGAVIYTIDNEQLASIINIDDYTCELHANNKNILGSCVLTAEYNGNVYTKTIKIIPLW